jgi:predicted nicotinamide N-methyase
VAQEHRSWSKATAKSDLFVLLNKPLRRQLLQQRLRLLQIERVEAFGEPASQSITRKVRRVVQLGEQPA